MDRGLISIIVPAYNAGSYLEPLVQNLARQTVQDYEVLFVNDNSVDDSETILKRLTARDSRLKYFCHDTNRGQGAARNTGLEHATGQYIMYVDADDAFAPNYLERMREVIEQDGSDIAICNSIWEYSDRRELRNMFLARPKTKHCLLAAGQALRRYYHIFDSDIWIPVEPWGKILRRSLIESHRIRHKETLFEDVVMTFEEMFVARKVSCIADHLYYYNRTNTKAATIHRQKEYVREMYRAPEGLFEVLKKYDAPEDLREYVTLFFFRFLNGTYSFFAKDGCCREELRYALEKYHSLLEEPRLSNHASFVLEQLAGFHAEMKRHGCPEMFSFFVAPYRDWLDAMVMESLYHSNRCGRREVLAAVRTLSRVPRLAFARLLRRAG